MEQDPNFDAIAAEQQQLDVLLDRGMKFTVPVRSFMRFFGKKERTFIVHQPMVYTMDCLSREFIEMDFSEERLKDDPFGEAKRLVAHNARRYARIVAIAILNDKWKIKLLGSVFAGYLENRITGKKLLEFTMLINSISNLGDFISSTRYLFVNRTTIPARVEKAMPETEPVD